MTELYPQLNEQKGLEVAVLMTNIDFFSGKSSFPTGSTKLEFYILNITGFTNSNFDIVCFTINKYMYGNKT